MTKLITDLYFQATQETLTDGSGNSYNPPRISVVGYPDRLNDKITYKSLQKFTFVPYKAAIIGGYCRASKLFDVRVKDLEVIKLNYGTRKQWFIAELAGKNKTVNIAGENYQPYLVINYKYDSPTVIHYHFGITRFACGNGVIRGLRFFAEQEVKTKDFKLCNPLFNPCMLTMLISQYDLAFTFMKKAQIQKSDFMNLIEIFLGRKIKNPSKRDSINHSELIPKEFEENESEFFERSINRFNDLGNNLFGVFNVFTDYATHFTQLENEKAEEDIHQAIISRQVRAGEFLDDLWEYLNDNDFLTFNDNLEDDKFGSTNINLEKVFQLEHFLNYLKEK